MCEMGDEENGSGVDGGRDKEGPGDNYGVN